jgi:DNA-binding NtrC family response regulator
MQAPGALDRRNEADVSPEHSQKLRILVIDDDQDIQTIVGDRLSMMGFEAIHVTNGPAALARLEHDDHRVPIHGVLLDLQEPLLGGLGVLKELCRRHPRLPVIIMSEVTDLRLLREAVRMGAREYLVMPFDVELLRRKCHHVFLGQPDTR